jgi:hypothetical protein
MPGAFSTAFSSAFDVGSEVPGMVDICYPAGTDWSCFGTPAEILELDPTIKARSEALAWSMLSALTAFRVSLCPVTIRPCAQRFGVWRVLAVHLRWLLVQRLRMFVASGLLLLVYLRGPSPRRGWPHRLGYSRRGGS